MHTMSFISFRSSPDRHDSLCRPIVGIVARGLILAILLSTLGDFLHVVLRGPDGADEQGADDRRGNLCKKKRKKKFPPFFFGGGNKFRSIWQNAGNTSFFATFLLSVFISALLTGKKRL